ncbi:MAG TPA: sigma-54 dependent transcriptional regulator [Anaerohalosphaeraceae bacterium]|nr:sigma-54 dependent transcriptional regulator [Anaerohalosphaeraceae bacterium]HOL31105.1 sigma-54 dependent transcriptional regulator [Anaerohalosphaeraceae bacterium]HOM74918.1 sigma-54 dependent transcriptional regulator [Anaerohalosphaeraceae bacterium]HPC63880.1 sigma-54 dependent transcriptional regulator [Anaerohalosphaeraceae bacterium]HPO68721.1 sigma-54 dependent transcriptional regulator [Anaerohalosphaeraceae bacterium]
MPKASILIADDDAIITNSLCEFLTMEGYQTAGVGTVAQARQKLKEQPFALVITDVNLPDGDGFDILDIVRANYPQTVVLLITGYGTIESAVEAIKKGAYDYLTKPIVDDDLLLAVERAIRQQSLMSENQQLRQQIENKYRLNNIISQNYKMSRIFELIEAVADSKTTILMTGASGTGKSLLAKAIHFRSLRRDQPFVEVSCGALPETLLESELFGHVKGAFTGAISDKEGKFLAANGGTIFLDEISSASPAMQVKLLRVLQERQFEPVGSNRTITVDTRVILASNRDLAEEVKQGRFREDLYYRINVVAINLPPLAERIGDVPLLADHFLKHFCLVHNRRKSGLTDQALHCLQSYHWPGNVRELENVIERAVLLSKGPLIDVEDLPQNVVQNSHRLGNYTHQSLKEALEGPERAIIRAALEANNWNRQETAKALDINRTTLYKKMKRYGLEEEAQRIGL